MKTLFTICVAAAFILAMPYPAQAATWEILDAGLQDTTNFVVQGGGTESRSDIAGDPGTRFNITLTGSSWQDTQIGDGFDLPSDNAGLVAATGNSGNLSAYAGYTMTIRNPNASGGFMVVLYMNTGWTDPGFGEPDRYYQDTSGWTWVKPGETVTLTLDFGNAVLCSVDGVWSPVANQAVQNLNHVTNIGLKIGSNMGTGGGDYEMPPGTAFNVDIVSRAGSWEIQDAGLTDAQFKREALWGDGTLNSKSDLASDPGTRLNVTLNCPASGTWQNMLIGDDFKDAGMSSNVVPIGAGGMGDLTAYSSYTMTIKNPPQNPGWFMAEIFLNTGWTDPPLSEPDNFYESGWVWLAPGQSHTFSINLTACVNLNHVSNIGLQVGSHSGTGDYQMPCGTPFDVDVVSNVLELNPQTLYIKTGTNLTTNMDVKNLLQRVNACQAMLGYDSKFIDPTGACVLPGGGIWDQVIYDSWSLGSGTSGEIDTAIGVNAYGATGTDADGTVAKITLTAGSVEGTTTIVFRPDASPDPGLTASTFLSDMSANPVWPTKYNSQIIVIDGTNPSVDNVSAMQFSGPELTPSGGGNVAVQGNVDIVVTVSDNLSGIAGIPTVKVTDAGSTITDITSTGVDNGGGVYSYTYTVSSATANGCATINVTVTDKSGNIGTGSDTFDINKNQITGTVDMSTLSGTNYSFIRNVMFVATGGVVSPKTWTIPVTFVNNTTTGIASSLLYTLTDVPTGTTGLSAKTAWSLRRKQVVALGGNGQATINFTGANDLLGGDINGSNSVNVLDYSVLKVNWLTINPVADINGDGQVQFLDYSLMKSNWFKTGDPQ